MSTATTSPIVRLAWTAMRIVANAPSQAALGYPFKVKAHTLTVTRANGAVEDHARSATVSEVTQPIRESHRTAILAAIVAIVAELKAEDEAQVKAWDETPVKDRKGDAPTVRDTATLIATARTAFYAEGAIEFAPTARATRSATVDDTDDLAAMLGEASDPS